MRSSGQRILTPAGVRHAVALGIILWTALGLGGYTLCISFLFIGSALTRVGKARKEALGIAEKRGGARGPENLWGAAGVAAICALIAALARTLPYTAPYAHLVNSLQTLEQCATTAYCGAISAKFADTASSEIGKAYGGRTYLLTTLQQVPRGTEGGVSREGSLAGFVATLVASVLAMAGGLLRNGTAGAIDFVIVVVAGNVANVVESLIGAGVQSQWQLTNEQVNFLNTLVGAMCAGILCFISLRA